MRQKINAIFFRIKLSFLLGSNFYQKIRLTFFLLIAGVSYDSQIVNKKFQISSGGYDYIVYIRNNFSDVFVLHEVFLKNEYQIDLPKETPKVIFDIGANVGYVSIYLQKTYPDAHIYAFEPDPDNYAQLVLNTKFNTKITCFQIAISSKNGISTFYQSPLFHMRNSLLPIENGAEISVETITLQEALLRTQEEKVDMLKFDVEGGERDIFTADTPYEKIESIVGELHPYRMQKNEYDELMNHLKKHFTLTLRSEGKKIFVYGKRA